MTQSSPEGWQSQVDNARRSIIRSAIVMFIFIVILVIIILLPNPELTKYLLISIGIMFVFGIGSIFISKLLIVMKKTGDKWIFMLLYNPSLYELLEKEIENMMKTNKYKYNKRIETSMTTVISPKSGKCYNQTYDVFFLNMPELKLKFSLEMVLGFESGGQVYTGGHSFPVSIENIRHENDMYARQLANQINNILGKINYKQYPKIDPNIAQ